MSDRSKQTKIGRYEILEKIGEGGFGIVYRGRDPMLDREWAIKVLKSDVASAPDFVERFHREARLAASLRHPNIVNVIELSEQEGRFFLVMDLLPGGPLSGLLKDGKPLPLNRAVELLKPIADALDYAHRKGMIHRDVKPSNIIFNEDGQPVLTDFGLGKSLSEAGATTTGMVLGTAEYMAPEQILGKEPSPAMDIYAFGVIAFQMLTGQVPFPGDSSFEIQKGHVERTIPDPRSINPTLPKEVSDLLSKALSKKPNERPTSASEIASELQKILIREYDQKVLELTETARKEMESYRFSDAISILQQVVSLEPNADVHGLLVECQRREHVLQEAREVANQKQMAETALKEFFNSEEWLRKTELISGNQVPIQNIEENNKMRRGLSFLTLALGLVITFLVSEAIGIFTFNKLYNDYDNAGEIYRPISITIALVVGLAITLVFVIRIWRHRKVPFIAIGLSFLSLTITLLLGSWFGNILYSALYNTNKLAGAEVRAVAPAVIWLTGIIIIAILSRSIWRRTS